MVCNNNLYVFISIVFLKTNINIKCIWSKCIAICLPAEKGCVGLSCFVHSVGLDATLVVDGNVAEVMLWPHALAAGRNQARLGLPAIGAGRFARQENGSVQLDAIESDVTADLHSLANVCVRWIGSTGRKEGGVLVCTDTGAEPSSVRVRSRAH